MAGCPEGQIFPNFSAKVWDVATALLSLRAPERLLAVGDGAKQSNAESAVCRYNRSDVDFVWCESATTRRHHIKLCFPFRRWRSCYSISMTIEIKLGANWLDANRFERALQKSEDALRQSDMTV